MISNEELYALTTQIKALKKETLNIPPEDAEKLWTNLVKRINLAIGETRLMMEFFRHRQEERLKETADLKA